MTEKVEYKRFKFIDKPLSSIGLGTYGLRDYKKAEEAFLYAIEKGINLLDTAEIYNTEDFVGKIAKIVGRDRLFIITKIWPKNLTQREKVIKSARNSLKRMGIDKADLILIHWPNDQMTIEDQVRIFETVYTEGFTNYIGVSNFTVEQMEHARSALKKTDIVFNEIEYNLSKRAPEKDIIPYCQRENIGILAYTPIEKGSPSVPIELSKRIGKTPVQIALNFLLNKEPVIPIPKTERLEHIKEIIGAMGWKLGPNDLSYINNS